MIALSLASASYFPEPAPARKFHWSWSRVSAFSGSFSLHLLIALALLIPPTAMEIRRISQEKPFEAVVITPPPEILPEPALPTPPAQRRPLPKPIAPPVPQITLTAPVAAPLPAPAVESIAAPSSSDHALTDAPASNSGMADSSPSALAYGNRTKVTYPIEALRRHEQGTVMLRVLVGTDGIPQQVEIDRSSGSHALDKAAREAVLRWSFKPGMRGGQAYAGWALVPITFSLPQ